MFNALYPFQQQKRNFQDECPHYVPSLKRIRLWDENMENLTQQNHFSVDPTDMSLIRNASPNLRVINKNDMDSVKFKYMPDLNAAQNPYYYEYNKLLFELYLERTRRCKSHNPFSSQSPV